MMKQLTAYHQTILRIHSSFDEHCRFLIFGFSFAVTFQACTYIYSIVEMRESKYVIQLSFALVLLYAFSIYGQKIVDAGELVNQSIYECNWTEKPLWYKKHLLIMLIRSSQSIEFHCFELVSVKNTFFMKVLQTTYTYFNFLKDTNK
ncbi:odorant receptor 85f-like [Nilaparvata lugens]|nr:odorant receptor 85f-like [Nilaparvata lugens]